MDNRKILIVLVFSIIGITIFSDMVNSCHLEAVTCYIDSSCQYQYSGSCYDWRLDLGGCQMGFSIGQYRVKDALSQCVGPEAKWSTSGFNGQVCKLKWGMTCGGYVDGKYDSSTGACVKCSGKIKTEQWYCSDGVGQKTNVNKCESACGADDVCDETPPR